MRDALTLVPLGVAELLVFHPVDTVAKRLMSNKAKVSPFFDFRPGRVPSLYFPGFTEDPLSYRFP